jgi:hypothetical protein
VDLRDDRNFPESLVLSKSLNRFVPGSPLLMHFCFLFTQLAKSHMLTNPCVTISIREEVGGRREKWPKQCMHI